MPQNRSTASAGDPYRTQRERLLAAMLGAIYDNGYEGATVTNVIARAGVSRPTFYDYFSDKDDCFLALYRDISRRLRDQIANAVSDCAPERALQEVVRQLTGQAEVEPLQAQFLANDALAGGRHALDERERAINEISNAVQKAHGLAARRAPSPDLPAWAVIGGTQWLIAQRIRRGERNLEQLADELTGWLQRYEQPIGEHRWSTLGSRPLPDHAAQLWELVDDHPAHVLGGRSLPLLQQLAQSRRGRILVATAESAIATGYAGTTVAAIAARARINKRDFYRHFRHKGEALLALHELAWQRSMAVGAAAYFSVKQRPERVWRCLLATSQFHAVHPAIAHVGLVETHALGPCAIQRIEESRHAFTTLLRADSETTSALPNTTAVEAIGAAIFEIAHDRVRHRRARDLPRYAYDATYLVLAPFLGVQAANRFVEQKLKDAKKHERPATKRRGRA